VDSSHCCTEPRKLSTITPTPTVVEMAMLSAAMATPVRLREVYTPRTAIRPDTPMTWPNILVVAWQNQDTSVGVRRLKPRIRMNSATNPDTRLSSTNSSASATAQLPRPSQARGRLKRWVRSSMRERSCTERGGENAASDAGINTETIVASMPIKPPLTIPAGCRRSSLTVSTK